MSEAEIVGQDLAAGYDGREGVFHRISLVGSVTLPGGARLGRDPPARAGVTPRR